MINSPLGALLESKAIQALIWKMYEENVGFPDWVRENIAKYMLPTSFDSTYFEGRCVAKPVSGCGGSSIKVIENDEVIERARICDLETDVFVFQQYCPAPEKLTMTEYGMRRLRFIASVWAIDGSEIGLCYRAGEGLTGRALWIVPGIFLVMTDRGSDMRAPSLCCFPDIAEICDAGRTKRNRNVARFGGASPSQMGPFRLATESSCGSLRPTQV